MRRAIIVLTSLVVAGVSYLHISGRSAPYEAALAARVHRLAFSRELRFSGLEIVTEADLAPLLPSERSNLWWWWRRDTVAERLQHEKLIERARVEPCALPRWGCFEISLVERRPDFVTQIGDKAWLVDGDGEFMGRAPLTALDPAAPANPAAPVIVRGIDLSGDSPATARARLDIVQKAIDVIEEGSGERVRAATVIGARDLEVRFLGKSFTATFGLPDGDTVRLVDEVSRFARLHAELGPRERLVKSIDLAFDRVAVVKFVE